MTLLKKINLHFRKGDVLSWSISTLFNKLKSKSHVLRSILFFFQNYSLIKLKDSKISVSNIWLYSCYKSFEYSQPEIVKYDEPFLLMKVYGQNLFWPSNEDYSGLTWLYQELHLPFWRNPHSYHHNKFKLKKGMTIIDFGACEGFFSLHAIQSGAFVYAVEPNPLLAASLQKTIHYNGSSDKNIAIINKAFSNFNGVAHFEMDSEISSRKILDNGQGTPVDVITLDRFVVSNNINKLDILKLDVEGWEEKIIEGGANVLKQLKPKLAIAVYHFPEQAQQIMRLLEGINPDYQFDLRGVSFYPKPDIARPMMLFAY